MNIPTGGALGLIKAKEIIKKEIPRLNDGRVEYDEIRFERLKQRKLNRLYPLTFFTSILILLLCACMVGFSIFGGLDISKLMSDIFPWLGTGGLPADDPFDTTDDTEASDDTDNEMSKPQEDTDKEDAPVSGTVDRDSLYEFDYSRVPSGETPIIPMDLSLLSYGSEYIHNSTGLDPDLRRLLAVELGYGELEYLSSAAPTVLIIHTHGTEAYSKDGAISFKDDGGELARSTEKEKNVVSVGKALGEALKRRGINSVHCEIMHDYDGYRDAYTRAEETIRNYLKRYPTIQLVIDLHRDSIVRSSGELVRPITVVNGRASAQVMCVVGSNWGGEENPRWEANLALALQFREYLNNEYEGLCRPAYLKPSTYNQELAPFSMLIEIGAAGNSIEEAYAACDAVAEGICAVLKK